MIDLNLLKPGGNSRGFRYLRSPTALLLFITIMATISMLSWYCHLRSEVGRRQELESQLLQECVELAHLETLAADEREKQLTLERRVTSLVDFIRKRQFPLKILNVVSASLGNEQGVSISRILHREQKVLLEGKTLNLNSIVAVVSSLNNSGLFESVQPIRWEKQGRLVFFEVLCVVKR
jgi:hypothetical protein